MVRAFCAISTNGLRHAALAGAALLVVAPHALAQTAPDPTAQDDGLSPGAIYVDADGVERDGAARTLTILGTDRPALARMDGRTLKGRRIVYNYGTGAASAEGEVTLVNPDGSVLNADLLELDEDLRAGVAVNLAIRGADDEKLMAATAVRRSETVNELNYALFTPCPICDDEGDYKTPSWDIQARQVVQDEEARVVYYRDALFRIGGVPVFYAPVFWHADPEVERATGFLPPIVQYSDERGLSWEQPYHVVVSPSEDWTVSPQINGRVNPFLNVSWRKRLTTGTILARAGYTYAENFGEVIDGDPDDDHRGYILAQGRFDPAGPWRWGFTAEGVTDKTLFDRYDITDAYADRGLYSVDERRLISQLFAERQTERSYVSVAAFHIQTLRLNPFYIPDPADPSAPIDANGQPLFEDDGLMPFVGPLVDARWEPREEILGGRLRMRGTAVALTRRDYVGGPTLSPEAIPPGDPPYADPAYPGVDSRRVSLEMDWRRALIAPVGLRYEPFLNARFDAYSVEDLPLGDDGTYTRAHVTAGLDVSFPLIRRFANGSDLILEPMVQVAVSPSADLDPNIPNEDSHVVELEESTLFRADRFPGFDLFEGGARLTLGGRATYNWDGGRHASLFLGRSFRDRREDAYLTPVPDDPTRLYDPTGLATKSSDWVVAATFQPTDRIEGWAHAQVADDGSLRKAEVTVRGGWGERNRADVSYIVNRTNPLPGPFNRNYEAIQFSGQQFVTGNWGVAFNAVGDLQNDRFTRTEFGLLYEDDCLRFEIGYRRKNTLVDPDGPSEGVYVRLNLATLGSSGSRWDEMR